MPCNTNITQSIVNSCHPIKGVKPIIYWDYRKNLSFTFVDNTIAAITAPPLGKIEVKKFGVNAGHEIVAVENQNNRFKHKVDTVINEGSEVLDGMDDIVFFVKHEADTVWSVYGAKHGCWKAAQSAMTNDNLGTIAVSFESREGMEEEYEKYTTSIDIATLQNMDNFNLIYGGTIATGGVIKLTIDKDKTGYALCPNGVIYTTVAGEISVTYTGIGGFRTVYVPKSNVGVVGINSSSIGGDITATGDTDYEFSLCPNLTGVIYNGIGTLSCIGDPLLSKIIAPNNKYINASNCALTAKSIGDILYAAYADNRAAVTYDFRGGDNALQGAVNTYLQTAYSGLTYATVYALLVTTNGGTILIDTV